MIVLDSFGIGQARDAEAFGDGGADTLRSVAATDALNIPNLRRIGLGNIDGVTALSPEAAPIGRYGRLSELSRGKDTTIGHWEIMGLISTNPLPTYPDGFPEDVISEFEAETGRGTLCNKPYSGTAVIADYGREHMETGKLIIYTSADSVFQIAAHEDIVSREELYGYCRTARRILKGKHGVGRVIARPYAGEYPFVRTSGRHDFSLEPWGETLLDKLKAEGRDAIGVGKIHDIFAGRGLTDYVYTTSNADGMQKTLEYAKRDFSGLCFVNLVDFDSAYGHRRDPEGYARALSEFDLALGELMATLGPDDMIMITADHGCDPSFKKTTDHTREYTPYLIWSPDIAPESMGTRQGFATIAEDVAAELGVSYRRIWSEGGEHTPEMLVALAEEAMAAAYAPYSGCKVGSALLARDGRVFLGCNIENASYTPTVCAERVAIFKAVSEGVHDFAAIAVAGGPGGVVAGRFSPCGVCRQVMAEHCTAPDFKAYLSLGGGDYESYTLDELLPVRFDKSDLK